MKVIYELARRVQFLDAAVPPNWRVPFRFSMQRLVGGLEPEMQLLPDLVARNKIAVDIGGNRGTYAYALAKLARHVVTFEPVPACARLLRAWARGKNVTVHECGLGDREDTLVLHVPRVRGALLTTRASLSRTDGEGMNVSVAVKTLDQFDLDDVGFIKIDVEGFEFATLNGARNTLLRCRPRLLVEIDIKQQSLELFSATFQLLEGMGYRGNYLRGGTLRPCGAEIHSSQPYCCNFIFVPVEQD